MAGAVKMSLAEVTEFLEREFPQGFARDRGRRIEAVGPGTARVRQLATDEHLRPGGTVSGPTMMALCDATIYVAILAAVGPVALAVTTNLSINFLKKPAPGDLIADCRMLKLGKRLAVGEVAVRSAEAAEDDLVAHCVATYSIPPDR
ncbi:MAG TPA: PaaI family thioesterase [Xanthobacteraceae bacterium]|nr:PaaI family thioesterase [Xanthobacteraceae bacterium]